METVRLPIINSDVRFQELEIPEVCVVKKKSRSKMGRRAVFYSDVDTGRRFAPHHLDLDEAVIHVGLR